MTPFEFLAKWGNPHFINQLTERQAAQTHFNDICALVNHPDAISYGNLEQFNFETRTVKPGGSKGWADVYYQGRFIWEYKGPQGDLAQAYKQLLLYKDELGNPPLLITCDLKTINIYTNYTDTVRQSYLIDLTRLVAADGLDLLKRVFHAPRPELDAFFKPQQTKEQRTLATADDFIRVANQLRGLAQTDFPDYTPEQQAHFLIRLLFCLFAENIGLLPKRLFSEWAALPADTSHNIQELLMMLQQLFGKMRVGGWFGFNKILHFNGGLFDDDSVPPLLTGEIMASLRQACRQDWSQLEPSIFGTLFERVLNEAKRKQLGAHYTRKEDIMLIVGPILMKPLRDEWQQLRIEAQFALKQGENGRFFPKLQQFAQKIAAMRVLDPACGSGNFLYVALRELLDLQKEVILFAQRHELGNIPLTVDPAQIYGLEVEVYAHELAQVTVWIGYIQWRFENGFENLGEPILRALHNIERHDAILSYNEQGQPFEPVWPVAEVIIGNPPFLGGQKMLAIFGEKYMKDLRMIYQGRLPGGVDLVCYWFEKARAMIERQQTQRAGLLTTQGIRGGANREVLQRIKTTGDIFWAWADKTWPESSGTMVHVSMVGFDGGTTKWHELNGKKVKRIHADLTSQVDLTQAQRLAENKKRAFQGPVKVGPFEIDNSLAQSMLAATNPSGKSNATVIKPWLNGSDIGGRARHKWIIDFDKLSLAEAAQFVVPFRYVEQHVKADREQNQNTQRRTFWWRLGASGIELLQAKASCQRLIITPRVSKYRLFIWAAAELVPDSAVVAITLESDYAFGVLHSKAHELWARRTGTQLRDAVSGFRYTPTSTFETFPFPYPLGSEPMDSPIVQQIGDWARRLVMFRDEWLNPPEVGEAILQKRTLTNLYNALEYYQQEVKPKHHDPKRWLSEIGHLLQLGRVRAETVITLAEIEQLAYLHQQLDQAVFAAYGWPADMDEEEILGRLLELNEARGA